MSIFCDTCSWSVDFLQEYLPYWEMQAVHGLVHSKNAHCFRKTGEVYALYLPENGGHTLDFSALQGAHNIHWYDPLRGGKLQQVSVKTINGGGMQKLGLPIVASNQDWVILVRPKN